MRLWFTLLAIFSIYLFANANIYSPEEEAEYEKFIKTYRAGIQTPQGLSPDGVNR